MGTGKPQSTATLFVLTAAMAATAHAAGILEDGKVLSPQLADAVRRADVAAIERILQHQPWQINARDERGWTPLMHAAFYADKTSVRVLLERGANVNATNDAGATALHYSATEFEKTHLLLKAGADVNVVSNLGNTPLMIAARSSKSASVVRLLLANQCDVHARNTYGVTALMIAASSDDVETVQLLLDRDADPSVAPYDTRRHEDGPTIAPVFGGGFTPLAWASLKGNLEMVKLLLDAGAIVDGQSMFGSPLTAAVQRNRTDVARLLLDRGADVGAVAPTDGWTPLMWAAGNEYGDADIVQLLLDHGANVNARRGGSWAPQMSIPHTALMIARRRGNSLVVETLLNAGAQDVDDPWATKVTPGPRRGLSAATVDRATVISSLSAAVPLLQRTAVDSAKEFALHGQNCVSCHNQLLPLVAVSLARKKGVLYDKLALNEMVIMLRHALEVRASHTSEVTFQPAPAPFFGYLLWGLASESTSTSFFSDLAVHCVAMHQANDGSWPQAFPRPPMVDSEFSSTAVAVRALALYPLPGRREEMEERVARAREWLWNTKPRVNEEHVYRLLGLYWAGEQSEHLAPLVKELVDLQRADGGWAQLPSLKSDAYATGQVLYALHEAGRMRTTDERYRMGLTYLVRTQLEDGSWFVRRRAYPFQPTMDPVFPHGRDAWISASATSWAVMALAAGLDNAAAGDETLVNQIPFAAKVNGDPRTLPLATDRAVRYDEDIRPILETSCLDCHSGNDPSGQYAMDSRSALIRGGLSGPPVVIPGNSADSLLIKHVAGLIEDVEMPPLPRRNEYEALNDEQIGLLRAWIDQGLPGINE